MPYLSNEMTFSALNFSRFVKCLANYETPKAYYTMPEVFSHFKTAWFYTLPVYIPTLNCQLYVTIAIASVV